MDETFRFFITELPPSLMDMNPYRKGITPSQAHVSVPDGLFEEEVGRNGFFGKYAHLYRTEPPVNWTRIEGPLKPQAFALREIAPDKGDFLSSRKVVLYNNDVKIIWADLSLPMDYAFRNADADELYFVHEGHGMLETDFGRMAYEPGDYVVLPRGTLYRFEPHQRSRMLILESQSEFELPDKGMLGQHALFDPAVVTIPEIMPYDELCLRPKQEYLVCIKRCGEITRVVYPSSPFNVAGWKGTLTAWKINVREIRPISCDRYHLPPSAHTTFVAKNFVVCSFLPRPLENGDPKAMKVPFYHSNIDFDEVLFYHSGDFFSRSGVGPGMLTFHPQGIHHGPQPKAVERTAKVTHTEEVAVMIDTKHPLYCAGSVDAVENKNYWKSWMEDSLK